MRSEVTSIYTVLTIYGCLEMLGLVPTCDLSSVDQQGADYGVFLMILTNTTTAGASKVRRDEEYGVGRRGKIRHRVHVPIPVQWCCISTVVARLGGSWRTWRLKARTTSGCDRFANP